MTDQQVPEHVFATALAAARDAAAEMDNAAQAAAVEAAISTAYRLSRSDGLVEAAELVRALPLSATLTEVAATLERQAEKVYLGTVQTLSGSALEAIRHQVQPWQGELG